MALSGLPIALNDVMEMSIELEATDLYHCGAAHADQWRSTQVDLSNMRVHANNQNKTKHAHKKPMTTIFKCVLRSALYNE